MFSARVIQKTSSANIYMQKFHSKVNLGIFPISRTLKTAKQRTNGKNRTTILSWSTELLLLIGSATNYMTHYTPYTQIVTGPVANCQSLLTADELHV